MSERAVESEVVRLRGRPGGERGSEAAAPSASASRTAFLSDASHALAACHSEKSLIEAIVRVAVPALADWCVVDAVEDAPSERVKLGILGEMIVPLVGRGRALGAMTLVASEKSGRRFGPDDLALAEAFASIAALALDGVRLFESEQRARAVAERSADRTARLQRVTAALSETLTPDQVADVALAEGLAALDGASGIVFVIAPGGAELEVLRSKGASPEALPKGGRERLDANAPAATAVRTASPVFIESPEEMVARFSGFEALSRRPECAALAVLPLAAHGRVGGALGFGWSEPRSFVAEDRAFLGALARQSAQALERGRLFVAERMARAEAVASRQRLSFLDQASEVLSGSLEREAMLSAIARLAAPALGDLFAIFVANDDGSFSCVAAAAEPRGENAARRMQQTVVPAASPFGTAIARGEPLLVPGEDQTNGLSLLDGSDLAEIAREMQLRTALLAPLRAGGRVLGALAVASSEPTRRYGGADLSLHEDLAHRIALALDNARLLREAKAAVRARDDFLSVASHELRTPLSALNLNLQGLLRGQTVPAPVETKLRGAERQVRRLAALIDKLLDISRITAGRLDLQLESVDLTALVAETLVRHRDEMAHAAAPVTFVADGPVEGHWDRLRLEQVVTNLLSNAIKYGAGGPIDVRLRSDGASAQLSVRDSGIGIDPADQARIFQRFERAVSGRHYGGLGLGLWIVRQIVEALGGTIRVESAPGHGSTFTVELPLGVVRTAAL